MDVISALCPDFNSLLENVAHRSNVFGTWCVVVTDDMSIIGSYVAPSDSVTGPNRSDPITARLRLSLGSSAPRYVAPSATSEETKHGKSTWKGVRVFRTRPRPMCLT